MPKPATMKRRTQSQAQESPAPTPRRGRREGQPSPSKKKKFGGILFPDERYTSYRVNIRPPKWNDKFKASQFWIGQLPNLELAQLNADAVYFYVGKPPFHFKDVVNLYPPITCMGIVPGTPEVLSTQEMFRTYTSAIAKGVEFKPQRKDFIAQVKGVIKLPEFPFPAPPEEDEHDKGEDTSEIELDESTLGALSMSSSDVPGSDPAHVVLVPSFELQHTELGSHLCSVGQYSDPFVKCSTSQFMPLTEGIDDCPTFQDEEGDLDLDQWINDLID